MVTDDYDEADRLFEEHLPLVERMGYQEFVAWTLFGMSLRYGYKADFDRYFDLAERAVEAARKVGEPVSEGAAHSSMAAAELAQGRTQEALERIEASRERVIATGAGLALPQTEITLAIVRATLGDLDSACSGLEAVVASGADFGWILCGALVGLATLLRLAGDSARSEEHARRALEISEAAGNRLRQAGAKEVLGRLAADRGEWSEAEVLLHEALASRAELGLRFWLPQTLDALAEVAAGLARHEDATRLLAAAERAHSDLGLVRWGLDQPHLEALERDLRATLGAEAFAAAWREGAGLALEEAVAWVRRGRGSRKRPPGGWESLTPTELEVTRHAAAGLTNVEIGEAMFISRATVKSHLSHIYSKLGVRNRAELTAEATQRLPAGRSPVDAVR